MLDSWLTALLKRVQPDVEQGQSTEQSKRLSRESLKDLGPPNLQLNFSSDHVGTYRYAKRIELIVTAIIAVTMQTGLLALAAATVLYQPLRNSIGSDPKGYGLPCYFAGSIMLSVGVGVCSYAVERNTTEFVWTILNKQEKSKDREDLDRYPRLIFLQKRQVVNDQAFDAFAMLAGPKRQIIASARNATSGDNANKQVSSSRSLHVSTLLLDISLIIVSHPRTDTRPATTSRGSLSPLVLRLWPAWALPPNSWACAA